MATMLPPDKLNDAIAREAFVLDAPPVCPSCDLTMSCTEVRISRRISAGVGLPKGVIVLPTWTCGKCGRRQPRLTL